MGNNIYILKKAKRKARRYICRIRPLSDEERRALKRRIILELTKADKATSRPTQ